MRSTSTKVVWVESVGSYVEMPESYDAAKVGPDDVAHDCALRAVDYSPQRISDAITSVGAAIAAEYIEQGATPETLRESVRSRSVPTVHDVEALEQEVGGGYVASYEAARDLGAAILRTLEA
jgi:phosphate-selective porin